MSCGFAAASISASPARTRSLVVNVQRLALRHEVLLDQTLFALDEHFAVALGEAAEDDLAVDLADDRLLLRLGAPRTARQRGADRP